MTINLESLIVEEGKKALRAQSDDGHMPGGRNGPYGHVETPLRNTGHWLIVWLKCYHATGDKAFKSAAKKALIYILGKNHRPHGLNWLHRNAKGRDRCNGLIGPAWTIEALYWAAMVFESEEAKKQAVEVFNLHPFDEKRGLWLRREIDGTTLSIDQTFNHQLWFAAAASMLAKLGCSEAGVKAARFADCASERHFQVYRFGLVKHRIELTLIDTALDRSPFVQKLMQIYRQSLGQSSVGINKKKRDIGYHAFNLMGFALLRNGLPAHSLWQNSKLKRAMAFGQSECYRLGVESPNPYSYTYNPVGFEMAYSIRNLASESLEKETYWIERQIDVLTCRGACAYGERAHDPITAAARIYEGAQLI